VSPGGLTATRHDRARAASHDGDGQDMYVITHQGWAVGSATTSRWMTGGLATTAHSRVSGSSGGVSSPTLHFSQVGGRASGFAGYW
jgi:hypothetical protein